MSLNGWFVHSATRTAAGGSFEISGAASWRWHPWPADFDSRVRHFMDDPELCAISKARGASLYALTFTRYLSVPGAKVVRVAVRGTLGECERLAKQWERACATETAHVVG